MKNYKKILLFIYCAIEICAIIFLIAELITPKVFFLLTMSMALMIGLYFMDKYKTQVSKK